MAFQTGHFHGHVDRRFNGTRQDRRILKLHGPKSGRRQLDDPQRAMTERRRTTWYLAVLFDLVRLESLTSSMQWKPDQSLTDKFLVASCTYRRQFWTAFGPRDLFHPSWAFSGRHVWT